MWRARTVGSVPDARRMGWRCHVVAECDRTASGVEAGNAFVVSTGGCSDRVTEKWAEANIAMSKHPVGVDVAGRDRPEVRCGTALVGHSSCSISTAK